MCWFNSWYKICHARQGQINHLEKGERTNSVLRKDNVNYFHVANSVQVTVKVCFEVKFINLQKLINKMVNITCVSKRLLDLRRDSNSSGMQWVRANARRLCLEKKINTEKTLYSISNFSLSMRQHNFSTGNYQSIVSKLNHF